MNKKVLLLAAAALTVPFAVQAQNQPQAVVVVEKAPGAGAVSEAVQLQGKIKSVDKKRRSVVIVGPNGNEMQMNLSDEVRNFDQIKVGDLVTLTMMHAIALELRKVANNGIRERVDSENAVVARPGEKPGVMVEKSVRVIANVVAVNGKAQTVTLRGPKRTVELAVKDPAMLQNVKVGDQVEGVYTEAVALTVTTAPKK
ncbi:MAG TPA: hypothetical protein PLE72_02925 [Azospira sp.]|nr:hypothetical protein [Azospira sp.]HNN08058.1 hypothetical protein [Azospira sp.]HNN45302.1 hypothetical protein [Azospira sp.]